MICEGRYREEAEGQSQLICYLECEWSASRSGHFNPGKDRGVSAGLEGHENSLPPGFNPGPSNPQGVALPSMLSRHIQVETKYKLHEGAAWLFAMYMCVCVNRVSHELRSLLRESVPYVKIYRYNPKHLYPKLNGYGDNGKRNFKVWQLLHTY